ncbi:hypothetical protein [Sphingopyxis flava]|uniref:Uncharacterized protein n=1 Tax=Sphingopyxis flava TaxID=1507287 RepID=A0A1T5ENC9_9SPHN|nr:hypothetical protein [Sphingopyxis flava]SKB85319.1 hypothetical protein SAMN06295937_102346 [Sphingopyxis flava]
MSRFSGLPSRSSISSGRFGGIRDALATLPNPQRVQRIAATARGERSSDRFSTAKADSGNAAKPSPAPAPAAAASMAAQAAVSREPWAVPAEVEARGAVYAAAYRKGFEQFGQQFARLQNHPAAKGRSWAAAQLLSEGWDESQIIARLPSMVTDRQRQIDAMWSRATAAVFGTTDAAHDPDPHGWVAIHAEIQERRDRDLHPVWAAALRR